MLIGINHIATVSKDLGRGSWWKEGVEAAETDMSKLVDRIAAPADA